MNGPWGRRLRRLVAAKIAALAWAHALGGRSKRPQLLGEARRVPVVTRVQWGKQHGWLVPAWIFQQETHAALCRGDFLPARWQVTVPWLLRETRPARGEDLLFFAAVLAVEATHPRALVHWLPARWHRSAAPQMTLTLKAESAARLVLHGLDASGSAAQCTAILRAGEAHRLTLPWQGVYALETRTWPHGRVGLRTADHGVYVVSAAGWENIALKGESVWLLGFTTWRQFWRQARYLRRGARSFPHGTHFSPAYGVPWCALEPLGAL